MVRSQQNLGIYTLRFCYSLERLNTIIVMHLFCVGAARLRACRRRTRTRANLLPNTKRLMVYILDICLSTTCRIAPHKPSQALSETTRCLCELQATSEMLPRDLQKSPWPNIGDQSLVFEKKCCICCTEFNLWCYHFPARAAGCVSGICVLILGGAHSVHLAESS